MEGITSEAASLAGHLELPNLCWLYDNNHISLDGKLSLSFSEDVPKRFEAYGWAITHVTDANDLAQLGKALAVLQAAGAAHADRRRLAHRLRQPEEAGHQRRARRAAGRGAGPRGEEELRLARGRAVPGPRRRPRALRTGHRRAGHASSGRTGRRSASGYRKEFPELAAELDRIDRLELPPGWDSELPVFPADPKGMATRESSGQVLNALAKKIPWLLGGAADLSGSTKTTIKGEPNLAAGEPGGRNIYFGVREHAMGAIVNGMVLSKLRAFGSTFLTFTDYMRAPIRLASLMEIPVVPRDDPRLHRPRRGRADAPAGRADRLAPGDARAPGAPPGGRERGHRVLPGGDGEQAPPGDPGLQPTGAPHLRPDEGTRRRRGARKGAYVLADAEGGKPEVLLMATGSEVRLIVEAYEKLKAEGIRARAISMPSLGASSSSSRPSTASRCSPPRSPPASPWSRRRRSAGKPTWGAPGRSWG